MRMEGDREREGWIEGGAKSDTAGSLSLGQTGVGVADDLAATAQGRIARTY